MKDTGSFVSRAPQWACLGAGLLLLAGCPPRTDGAFDLSGLADGRYDEPYSGQLAVVDYSGPASYSVVAGALPDGLAVDEAGRVEGTAALGGTFEFDVLASGMNSVEDFVGTASITIRTDHLEDAFLGYEHDQTNNMSELNFNPPLMHQIWVRLVGTGVTDKSDWTMNPGIYLPGPDGVASGGDFDDERIANVDFAELDVDFRDWTPTIEERSFPNQGYPNPHTPEDLPPSLSGEGVFSAAGDTGEATVELSHPDYDGSIVRQFQIIPPDWCPNGEHEGGPNNDGVCE